MSIFDKAECVCRANFSLDIQHLNISCVVPEAIPAQSGRPSSILFGSKHLVKAAHFSWCLGNSLPKKQTAHLLEAFLLEDPCFKLLES